MSSATTTSVPSGIGHRSSIPASLRSSGIAIGRAYGYTDTSTAALQRILRTIVRPGGGHGTASIKEVARQAGVSIGTVSATCSTVPTGRHRPPGSGCSTRSTSSATSATTPPASCGPASSRTIALVVLDVANPFFTDVVRRRRARSARPDTARPDRLQQRRGRRAGSAAYLELLEEQRVRGVLITPVDDDGDSRCDAAHRARHPGGAGRPRLGPARPLLGGGRRRARRPTSPATHLLEQGHRRIAFVGGPLAIRPGRRPARRGAPSAGPARAAELRVACSTPSLTVAAGRRAAEELAELPAADAPDRRVLRQRPARARRAAGDDAARRPGAGRHGDRRLRRHRVRRRRRPPLSSVRQPRDQLGRTAAELLTAELDEGEAHQHRHVMFKPELVVRESTCPREGGSQAEALRRPRRAERPFRASSRYENAEIACQTLRRTFHAIARRSKRFDLLRDLWRD